MTALSSRDRNAVLRLLRAAQVAYARSRLPKKQVLDGAGDQQRLRESVAATRAAAADLSHALRDRTEIVWKDLIAGIDDDDAAWRVAKRVVPQLFAELRPLLGDDPEAAFLPQPPPPKPRKVPRASSR
ncbi:MAG TPA: hypothetical protein VKR80_06410 [Candidatus Limnocylindria bacterium]|nr:hypothetical protein [Candidatus Limnocylindria bacterium]